MVDYGKTLYPPGRHPSQPTNRVSVWRYAENFISIGSGLD